MNDLPNISEEELAGLFAYLDGALDTLPTERAALRLDRLRHHAANLRSLVRSGVNDLGGMGDAGRSFKSWAEGLGVFPNA